MASRSSAAAPRTASLPFSSSEPTLSRPTVGSIRPRTVRAKTSPITRELHQIVGVAFDIGAEIEHHALAAPGREERRDRRPVDPRQRLQHELGHRHQRAGIAGGDDAVGAVPSATASIASRMLERRAGAQRHATAWRRRRRPRRCGATSRALRERAAAWRAAARSGASSPNSRKLHVGIALQRDVGALDHHAGA